MRPVRVAVIGEAPQDVWQRSPLHRPGRRPYFEKMKSRAKIYATGNGRCNRPTCTWTIPVTTRGQLTKMEVH